MKKNQMEKWQLQYDLFEEPKFCSVEKAFKDVDLTIEEVDVARSFLNFEQNKHDRNSWISKKLGRHASKFGFIDDRDYYALDQKMLDVYGEVLGFFAHQVNTINGSLTSDNYLEMYRLLSFSTSKSREFISFVRKSRSELDSKFRGEDYEFPKCDGEPEYFNEWFNEQFQKSVSSQKTEKVEKVKK